MIYTPLEARSVWCPMVRHEGRVAFNTGPDNQNRVNADPRGNKPIDGQEFGCHCVADKCAMWRWAQQTQSLPTKTEGATGQIAVTYENRTVRTHGYCGLAGRPEVA